MRSRKRISRRRSNKMFKKGRKASRRRGLKIGMRGGRRL